MIDCLHGDDPCQKFYLFLGWVSGGSKAWRALQKRWGEPWLVLISCNRRQLILRTRLMLDAYIHTHTRINLNIYTSTACPDIHIGICKTPSQPCKEPAIISFPPWPPWPCLCRPGCFLGPWLVLCVKLGFGKGFNQEPAKVDFFHIFSRPKKARSKENCTSREVSEGCILHVCNLYRMNM